MPNLYNQKQSGKNGPCNYRYVSDVVCSINAHGGAYSTQTVRHKDTNELRCILLYSGQWIEGIWILGIHIDHKPTLLLVVEDGFEKQFDKHKPMLQKLKFNVTRIVP